MNKQEKEYCKFIGNSLRRIRQNTGKSVRLFAYENDIPQATLSRVERGDNEPQLVTLKKIAEGFGLKMSELFYKIEENMAEDFKIFTSDHY